MRTLRLLLTCIALVFFLTPAFAAEPVATAPVVASQPAPAVAAPAPAVTPTPAPATAPVPAAALPPTCPPGQQPVLTPSGNYVCAPLPLDPGTDLAGTVKAIFALAKAGNWAGAVLLALCLLVWVARKFGGMIPGPVGAWFKSDIGGMVTTFLGSLTAVLGGAAYIGVPVTGTTALGAFLLAFTAMGAWRSVKLLLRKLPESWQKKLDWLFDLLPKDDAKP